MELLENLGRCEKPLKVFARSPEPARRKPPSGRVQLQFR
jgi:hypothetical protein